MKFSYTAFDKSGQPTSEVIEAVSREDAIEQIRRQGKFVSQISQSGTASSGGGRGQRLGGTGRRLRNLAMFAKQLHVLVTSGTPIVQAISAIERQSEQNAWRDAIGTIRAKVEEGVPLSEAMRLRSDCFDTIARSLVAAGESSGAMGPMLERLALLVNKQLHLRRSIVSALVYPLLLILMGVGVLLLMLLFVLPRFGLLFSNLDAALPPTTRLLLWCSDILWNYWWAVILLAGTAGFAIYRWIFSPAGRERIHSAVLETPRLNKIVRGVFSARVSRMLGTLLESRVALTEAIELTRAAAGNMRYQELLDSAGAAVARGEPISSVLSASDLISPCVQEAIRTGEQSGQLGAPLVQMADFLDGENDAIIKAATTLIEPIILIILGLFVGLIALSMFLPLFDLVSAARGGQ